MQSVYLGLFSSIFKAVYNAILKPIIDFFGGLLNSVFTWVFDNILKPLLIDVFFPLFKGLAEMIYEIIAGMLYELMAEILKIVDAIQVVFNVFAGIDSVTYDNEQYYLLDLLFSNQQVQHATWVLIAISLILMMAFSLISVLRSIADLSDEMKNPVGKVLRLTGSSFLKLITIPIVCMLMIRLSGAVLKSVYTGINDVVTASTDTKGNSKTTLGRTIFCIATLDAAKLSAYNTSTSPDTAGIYDGQSIRLGGKGGEAPNADGQRGDLYVEVRVRAHKTLTREGDLILSEITIPMTDAVLGTEVKVETVDGEITMKVPAGTQPGTNFKLSGHGAPRLGTDQRGPHIVTINVEIPKNLNKKQKELIEEFAKAKKRGLFH